ncbi:MAG: hypothetical protein J0I71_15600 [Rhodanobacter sp.]|mgnify:CR=1 FL=1|jgi:hypothetical protein|nr:hypothetical protein [Rhodanobacter sp.]
MEATSLTGRTLKAVWLFPSGPVHPAWVNELTTPIVTYDAFLELADDVFLQLNACEVVLDEEKYPSLGLELRESSPAGLRVLQPDGHVIEAQQVQECGALLPALITSVEQSDPLEEGAISQYVIVLGQAGRIIFRHIMPPTTLGIDVHLTGRSPNPSSKRTREKPRAA